MAKSTKKATPLTSVKSNGTPTAVPYCPTQDRVIVKMEAPDETTESGILIPDTAKVSHVGRIIKVGPGRLTAEGLVPMSLKEGQRVMVAAGRFDTFNWQGEEYILLHEHQIILTIEETL